MRAGLRARDRYLGIEVGEALEISEQTVTRLLSAAKSGLSYKKVPNRERSVARNPATFVVSSK
jgi:hypothetical protein